MTKYMKYVSCGNSFGRLTPQGPKPLMAMLEVTQRCNMACPICFAGSGKTGKDLSLKAIRKSLNNLLEITGTPIPIQISGGEPTLRDDLGDIIELAGSLGYRNIELITNGLRIVAEPGYLETLKSKGLTAVYLQFDGLQPETTRTIRGRDMSGIRTRAVQTIREADLCCTLAVVVVRGVNDREIGDIVRFAIEHIDVVRAINFQAATRLTGRFEMTEDFRGYTLAELLHLIESQTGVGADTFLSDPLGHPDCNAMSQVYVVEGQLEPLFKYISPEDVRRFLGDNGREKILAGFAGKSDFFFRHLMSPAAWRLIAKAAPIFGTNPYNVLKSKHILLFAKSFMEKEGMDQARIGQCCYAITTPDGVYSFCAYNNHYRFGENYSSHGKERHGCHSE
ncbi:MAG: radical SAM protein [Desulfobacterales bacterium]|nr:radical SAM protein [Desulfobacterales bacterium]